MRRAAAGLLLSLLGLPTAMGAQTEFTATEGDWFNPANWSTGQVPTGVDEVEVTNGTARTSATSPFYPGAGTALEASRLIVGGFSEVGDPTFGALETMGVDVVVDELHVGQGPGNLATGRVDVGGSLFSNVEIVVGRGFAENGHGDGVLSVDGDVIGRAPDPLGRVSLLVVGSVAFGGRSTSVAEVGGDVRGFNTVGVGGAFGFSGTANHVEGMLHVAGDVELPGILDVGRAEGGTARGSVAVDRDVAASLLAGTAAFVPGSPSFSDRGSATGSIDIGGSLLEGGISAGLTFRGQGLSEGRVSIAGDADTRGVTVGVIRSTGGPVLQTDEAHGVLTVGNRMASGGSGMEIGISAGGIATGRVEVEALSGYRDISVGLAVSSDLSASADGRLIVRSGGVSGDGLRFNVGFSSEGGEAVGHAEITGAMGFYRSFRVGTGSGGTASGTLVLSQGSLTGRDMTVGVSTGEALVDGRIHLDRFHVGLNEDLTLGVGSTLAIELRGLIRGTEFGAIDADLAVLDGDLELIFQNDAGPGIYDLIVSGGMDNISGAFDVVTTTGIDSTLVSYGTEVASVGGKLVEVFRVRVIPESSTAALFMLGLVAIAWTRRASVH